jgi:hypothetical protein
LLFDPAQLAEQAPLVRRAAASGHTVGFVLEEESEENALAALTEGNRLLQSICCTRSWVADASGLSVETQAALMEQGWCLWESQVDLTDGEEQTAAGVYRTITKGTDTVRATLSPSAVQWLDGLVSRIVSGGHTLYTPTESEL